MGVAQVPVRVCACPQRDMRLAERKLGRAVKKEEEAEDEDQFMHASPAKATMKSKAAAAASSSGGGSESRSSRGGAVAMETATKAAGGPAGSLKRPLDAQGPYELTVSAYACVCGGFKGERGGFGWLES